MRWIKERLPHIQRSTGNLTCWRIYGIKPRFHLCIFDYTKTSFYTRQSAWVRIRVCGVTIYERNHHLSGLPRHG